jgi:hypothetical protein
MLITNHQRTTAVATRRIPLCDREEPTQLIVDPEGLLRRAKQIFSHVEDTHVMTKKARPMNAWTVDLMG